MGIEEIVVTIIVAFILVPVAGMIGWVIRLRKPSPPPPAPSLPEAAAQVEETLALLRHEEHTLHIDEIAVDAQGPEDARANSNVAHFRRRR